MRTHHRDQPRQTRGGVEAGALAKLTEEMPSSQEVSTLVPPSSQERVPGTPSELISTSSVEVAETPKFGHTGELLNQTYSPY